jgi:hypothetical protein
MLERIDRELLVFECLNVWYINKKWRQRLDCKWIVPKYGKRISINCYNLFSNPFDSFVKKGLMYML